MCAYARQRTIFPYFQVEAHNRVGSTNSNSICWAPLYHHTHMTLQQSTAINIQLSLSLVLALRPHNTFAHAPIYPHAYTQTHRQTHTLTHNFTKCSSIEKGSMKKLVVFFFALFEMCVSMSLGLLARSYVLSHIVAALLNSMHMRIKSRQTVSKFYTHQYI